MNLCEYGCGNKAKHQLKNGKWCCSKSHNSCIIKRKPLTEEQKKEHSLKMKKLWGNPNSNFNNKKRKKRLKKSIKKSWQDPSSKLNSKQRNLKIKEGLENAWLNKNSKFNSKIFIDTQRINQRITIEKIKEKYLIFSKEEEIRYNPEKSPEEKEIQVRCKNHKCKNSKEQGGWFTTTKSQLYERIRQLEHVDGNGGCYLYCSGRCKEECILYNLRSDPYETKNIERLYTETEYQIWRQEVFERASSLCEYCEEPAEHAHHIMPQKLQPFFALDPDYGVACCEGCHYKYGHKSETECDTWNLAQIVCEEK